MINDAELAKWAPRVLSILRIMVALLFMQHGLSKHFGWPGSAPQGFSAMSLAGLAGTMEIIGGALLALGLFTRVTAFIVSGEMAFAYFISHAGSSFFPYNNRGSLAVLYCFVFLYIAVAGGGPWSVDATRNQSK